MRKVTVKVKKGEGAEVKKKAEEQSGKNIFVQPLEDGEQVTVSLNNNQVSKFISSISYLKQAEINFIPRGVIALYPPQDEAPDQVADVSYRSPFEIYLGGLQSVGSKTGLIAYSVAGAILVWVGLYTNTSYLLVAAMLVSPFAGPAMNSALGAAAGKWNLLKQSLLRYFMAIGTAVVVSFLLSLILQIQYASPMMVSVSQVSQITFLLPLAAGIAGGVNLIQSERDSLVAGAAVGMLVAASLAPPTGLIGIGVYIGNWQLVRTGVFLLILQLVIIQLTAALVFRFMGKVTIKGVRFSDGKENVFRLSLLTSALIIAAMLFWQFSNQPTLQKASLNTKIAGVIRAELQKMPDVKAIEVNARFTRGTLPNANPVLCELYLLNQNDSLTDEQVKQRVVSILRKKINAQHYNAEPMFAVTMLQTE